MPPKRQGQGPAAGKAAAAGPADGHAAQVRKLWAAWHKGKREQALAQLEKLDGEHPSGLCSLALAKLKVLEGINEARKVEAADVRELSVIVRLQAAAAHAARGALEHRSLHCLSLLAHVMYLCRGRHGAKARAKIWQQLKERYPEDSSLAKDVEGWADPRLEELPVSVPSDRWALDFKDLAARKSITPEKYGTEVRGFMEAVRGLCSMIDMVRAAGSKATIINTDDTEPALPVDRGMVQAPIFPEGPRLALGAFIREQDARQAAQARGAPAAGPTPTQRASEGERGVRKVVRLGRQEDERLSRREDLHRVAERNRKEAALREARDRAGRLRAYLEARVRAASEESQWEVLSKEASMPVPQFMQVLGELEGRGSIPAEQAVRAREAAELLAEGGSVCYSLPPGVGQRGSSSGRPAEGSSGSMLSSEEFDWALHEAVQLGFSWEEQELMPLQRRGLASQMSIWGQLLDSQPLPDVAGGLSVCGPSSSRIPEGPIEVSECSGDLQVLLEDPANCFFSPASGHSAATSVSRRKPDTSSDDDEEESKDRFRTSHLDRQYASLLCICANVDSIVPGLPSEPAAMEPIRALMPQSELHKIHHTLSRALLGHFMLRELRAPARAPSAAEAGRLLQEGRSNITQSTLLSKLVTTVAEEPTAVQRTSALLSFFSSQARERQFKLLEQPVSLCAALSLALAPRPERSRAPEARDVLLQVKRAAAEDVVRGLSLLQQHGRLLLPTIDVLIGWLMCWEEAAAQVEEVAVEDGTSSTAPASASASPAGGQASEDLGREGPLVVKLLLSGGEGEEGGGPGQWRRMCGGGSVQEAEEAASQGLVRRLRVLPLPALMRMHAFVCLHLAWHFPSGVATSPEAQEQQHVAKEGQVQCEVTPDGTIRITPAALDLVAWEESLAAAILGTEGPQAAAAARKKGATFQVAARPAGSKPAGHEQGCSALASAACGLVQASIEAALPQGLPPADGGPSVSTQQQLSVSSQLAMAQRLLALLALVRGSLHQGQARAQHAFMGVAYRIQAAIEQLHQEPHRIVPDLQGMLPSFASSVTDAINKNKALASTSAALQAIMDACRFTKEAELGEGFLRNIKTSLPKGASGIEQMFETGSAGILLHWFESITSQCKSRAQTTHMMAKMELENGLARKDEGLEKLLPSLGQLAKLIDNTTRQGEMSRAGMAVVVEQSLEWLAFTRHLVLRSTQRLVHILQRLGPVEEVLFVNLERLLSGMRNDCARSCAAEAGDVLLHHVLPAKWEAAMKLLPPGLLDAAPASTADAAAGPAATKAAEAAAAALLAEEQQEMEAKQARAEKKRRAAEAHERQRAAQLAKQHAQQMERQQQEQAEETATRGAGADAAASDAAAATAAAVLVAMRAEPQGQSPASEPSSSGFNAPEAPAVVSRPAKGQPAAEQPVAPPQQQAERDSGGRRAPEPPASMRHVRSRDDVEPAERPLPLLSAVRRGSAEGRRRRSAAQQGPQQAEPPSGTAAEMQQPGPSAASPGAAERSAQASGTEATPHRLQAGQQRPPAARAAECLQQRQQPGANPSPPAAATAAAQPGQGSAAVAHSAEATAAGREPGSSPGQPPRVEAKSSHLPGLIPSLAASSRWPPEASAAATAEPCSTGAPLSMASSGPSLELEVAAQLAAAQEQGLLGEDGEVDISRLEEVLGGSPTAGPAAAAPPPAAATLLPAAAAAQGGSNQVLLPPKRAPSSRLPPGSSAAERAGPGPLPAPSTEAGRRQVEAAGLPAAAGPQEEVPRFVKWEGDWLCRCGQINGLRQNCIQCGKWSPCREWFRGRCTKRECSLSHLPFDLPAQKPREWGTGPLANPEPGSEYRPSRAPTTPASKPAPAPATAQQEQAQPQPPQARQPPAPQGMPQGSQRAALPPRPDSQPRAGWASLGRVAQARQGAAAWGKPAGTAAAAAAWGSPAVSPSGAGELPSSSGWGPAAGGSTAAWGPAAPPASASSPQPASRPAWGPAAQEQQQQQQPHQPATSWAAAATAGTQRAQQGLEPGVGEQLQPDGGEDEDLLALLQNLGVNASGEGEEWAGSEWSFGASNTAQPLGEPAWPSIGQGQDDAEQASLVYARQQQQQLLSSFIAQQPPQQQQQQPAAAGISLPPSSGELARPGLANEAGEYNCFLNVIIQCLWYCADFRQQVSGWPPALYEGRPVLRALRGLFAAFAAEEEGKRQRTIAAGARQAIDPTPLREALAALPQQGQLFRKGEMSDAAEVLDAIYQQVNAAVAELQGTAAGAAGVEALFGSAVREEVHCADCGRTTQKSAYTQYFFNTQATAIRMQRVVAAAEEGAGAGPSLGRLLRLVEAQAVKTCDTDAAGCGTWNPVTHFLERAPRVFALQLAWESHHEEGADIAATLEGVQPTIDLGDVYQAHEAGRDVYRLRSMVCYYGAHYQAYVLVPDLKRWLLFDDTRVSNVGTWADVRTKCQLGRVQPSVLFYEKAA